jgi:hypothetical protein
MTQYSFGTGTLILKRTDVSLTQPALIGTLQENSIDFDQKLESLLGQNKVAVALAGAELKITGKAKFARLQATQISNLFFGALATQTAPAMTLMTATGEAHTVSGGAVTVTNGATFVEDLGVFTAAGVQLQPVASSPVAGVSYVPGAANTGTYTFNASDNGTAYTFYYRYTITSGGQQVALTNQPMGPVPTFELNFQETFNYFGVQKTINVVFNACASSKLTLPFSNTKWTIAEFDWQAQADASGNIGIISLSE